MYFRSSRKVYDMSAKWTRMGDYDVEIKRIDRGWWQAILWKENKEKGVVERVRVLDATRRKFALSHAKSIALPGKGR